MLWDNNRCLIGPPSRSLRAVVHCFSLLSTIYNSNVFSFSDCSFNMSKSKVTCAVALPIRTAQQRAPPTHHRACTRQRSTMRIVLRNEIGLINSYTCEASFAGSTTVYTKPPATTAHTSTTNCANTLSNRFERYPLFLLSGPQCWQPLHHAPPPTYGIPVGDVHSGVRFSPPCQAARPTPRREPF